MDPYEFLQQIDAADFEAQALATFERQYASIPVYRHYIDLLGKVKPTCLSEIPFLPIDFFKTQLLTPSAATIVKTFKSSGTTQHIRSQHHLTDLRWYDASLTLGFERVFGKVSDYVFIALLPSYLENGDSSLIYMVDQLIQKSNSSLSGYYLSQVADVLSVYNQALSQGKKPFVFGVSYALLDLAELGSQLPEALILETGGMKGRRQELTKIELHQLLQQGFGVQQILSLY